MTIADLEAMPDDGNRYEIIEGELFVSCAPGLTHQRALGNILFLIKSYLVNRPIGEVIATPRLILSEYSGVIPDLVFFTNEARDRIISGDRLVRAPDLAIEILSPGAENIRRDRVAKRQLYGRHGVREYWMIDLENRAVEIYLLAGGALELIVTVKDDDKLSTAVLPGFTCTVAEIFKV
ncbi:MAG: Uma2 family endonuclease [Pyrinomonadaceae bacterium]